FRGLAQFPFTTTTCVVLTEEGARFVRWACPAPERQAVREDASRPRLPDTGRRSVPCWDRQALELYFAGWLVKRFRGPAGNQQLILGSLEELGWPWHCDDPLPRRDGLKPQKRLHDAINRLNRHQVHRLLHFRGDGQGRGLCWEPIVETATTLPPTCH